MAGVKKTDVIDELDRLVREDMIVGREIAKQERARDVRIRFYSQKIREESEPFDRELAPLTERRERLRRAILDLWAAHHDRETTLDLPCAKVSRRNYRELVVRDTEALLDALDRADRLDLVDHTFDGKTVARLVAEGKLPGLTDGAVEVIDHHNLQVRPRGESRSA